MKPGNKIQIKVNHETVNYTIAKVDNRGHVYVRMNQQDYDLINQRSHADKLTNKMTVTFTINDIMYICRDTLSCMYFYTENTAKFELVEAPKFGAALK